MVQALRRATISHSPSSHALASGGRSTRTGAARARIARKIGEELHLRIGVRDPETRFPSSPLHVPVGPEGTLVPRTAEGAIAARRLIAEGVNVNVTLLFSLDAYARIIEAYLGGLDDRVKAGVSSEGGISLPSTNWDAPWYLGPAAKKPASGGNAGYDDFQAGGLDDVVQVVVPDAREPHRAEAVVFHLQTDHRVGSTPTISTTPRAAWSARSCWGSSFSACSRPWAW